MQTENCRDVFQTQNSLVVELKFLSTRPVCLNLREAMEGSQWELKGWRKAFGGDAIKLSIE